MVPDRHHRGHQNSRKESEETWRLTPFPREKSKRQPTIIEALRRDLAGCQNHRRQRVKRPNDGGLGRNCHRSAGLRSGIRLRAPLALSCRFGNRRSKCNCRGWRQCRDAPCGLFVRRNVSTNHLTR
jgi:hypothetical protein